VCSRVDRIELCREEVMLNVTVENIGELAVVECEGRIVRSESAYRLREAVTSQTDSRIVVLELSKVSAVGGGGVGLLVFLQRWTREHNIRFLLFNPSKSVQSRLKRARSIAEFYIPSVEEVRALLAYANNRYALAA
jgi:anti-anti-sigma regulatory factor